MTTIYSKSVAAIIRRVCPELEQCYELAYGKSYSMELLMVSMHTDEYNLEDMIRRLDQVLEHYCMITNSQ